MKNEVLMGKLLKEGNIKLKNERLEESKIWENKINGGMKKENLIEEIIEIRLRYEMWRNRIKNEDVVKN